MIITIRELQEKTYEIINMALREDEPIKIKTNRNCIALINEETIDKIKKVIKIKGL